MEVQTMSNTKYKLSYDEVRVIVIALVELKNQLIAEGRYDPCQGLTAAEEIRDMILTLMFSPDTETDAGSEHYKMMFSRLLLQTIIMMQKYKVRMTMSNVSKLLIKENMDMLLNDPKRNVSVVDREEMKKVS
jgi:hypothetical protein